MNRYLAVHYVTWLSDVFGTFSSVEEAEEFLNSRLDPAYDKNEFVILEWEVSDSPKMYKSLDELLGRE